MTNRRGFLFSVAAAVGLMAWGTKRHHTHNYLWLDDGQERRKTVEFCYCDTRATRKIHPKDMTQLK